MEPENINDQDLLEEAAPDRPEKKRKTGRIVIISILCVLAVIIGAGIYLINYYFNKINFINTSTESQLSPSEFFAQESSYWASVNSQENDLTDPEPTDADSTEPTGESAEAPVVRTVRSPYQADAYRSTLSADDEQVIFDHPVVPTVAQTIEPLHDEDLINIMLVGQDTRNTAYRERSDTMILVSINPKTHKVALISFLRDLYVPLGGGYGWNRLNTAFFIGGLPKMYEVFENVFGLHIDGAVYINFGQFMSLVNLLGGVDITLNETEAKWLRKTLELSVPDMRYWGQIVEALMPSIKSGTTVKAAIEALAGAELSYAFTDVHGGAAPENPAKAKVSSLWLDAAGTEKAVAGKYYPLQKTIYITYTESRISFPKIDPDSSVASAVSLLKSCGFKVAYADKNGNAAPSDSKSALVVKVTKDAAGNQTIAAGDKFDNGTTVYITYTENKANVPNLPAGITVQEAETQLKANGFRVSWTSSCGGVAPADKTKATVTGVYLDSAGTNAVHAGDKLDINTTLYIAYQEIEDPKIVMPTIYAGESVRSAVQKLQAAGFTAAYSSANGGAAPSNPDTATVVKVTLDQAGNNAAAPGSEWDQNTVVYITYNVPVPPSSEPETTPEETTHEETTPEETTPEETTPEETTPEETTPEETTPEETTPEETTPEETTPEETTPAETTQEETTPAETTAAETTAEENIITPPSNEGRIDESRDGGNAVIYPTQPANEGQSGTSVKTVRSLYNPLLASKVITTSNKKSSNSDSSDEPYYLQNIQPGDVHLDGMQTLAYCRMRKLDSDFKRTERQRTVLNILFNKIKTSSLAELNNLLEQMLPQISSDLTKAEMFRIAALILPYFSSIDLELHSIPAAGAYGFATIDGMAVVTMNQAGNINALRSWLPF